MKGPPRLLESADDRVRGLLVTALDDAPSGRSLPQLRALLGVSAIAAVSGAAASATAEASSSGSRALGHDAVAPEAASEALSRAATGALGKGTGVGGALASAGIAKFLIVGALLGGLVCGIAILGGVGQRGSNAAQQRDASASAPPAPLVPAPSPELRRDESPAPVPVEALAEQAPELRAERPPARAKKLTPEKRATSAVAKAPLGTASDEANALIAEVKRIDGARRSLNSGDPARALQALDSYDAASPRGALTREALLLRVEALAAQGRLSASQALARRYLAQYPGDVHAQRMKELLAK